jgi:uncharacterized membrane protein
MSRWINTNSFTIKKTASYYVTHIMVAAMVAYALTGDFLVAITLSLLEPTVQAFVYFFHERMWQSAAEKRKHTDSIPSPQTGYASGEV